MPSGLGPYVLDKMEGLKQKSASFREGSSCNFHSHMEEGTIEKSNALLQRHPAITNLFPVNCRGVAAG